MGYTPVQHAKGAGTSSAVVSLSTGLTTGNRLFVVGSANSSGALTVTVNTGTLSTVTTIGPIDSTARIQMWEYQIVTGGATSVSVVFGGAVPTEAHVLEASYTGTPAAAVFQTGTSSGTAHHLSSAVSYVAGDIVIQGSHAQTAAGFSSAAGWTLIGGSTNPRGGAQFLAASGTGSTTGGIVSAANEITVNILAVFSSPVASTGVRPVLVGGSLVNRGVTMKGLVR
jgi:hypothetical protein